MRHEFDTWRNLARKKKHGNLAVQAKQELRIWVLKVIICGYSMIFWIFMLMLLAYL